MLLIPGLCIATIALAFAFLAEGRGFEPSARFLLVTWFALGLMTDLALGAWTRHRLLTGFRNMAAERYVTRVPFWKRLLTG